MPSTIPTCSTLVRIASALALLTVSLAAFVVVAAPPASAAVVRPFTQVYSAQTNGSLQVTGNTMLTCGTSLACTQAQGGTAASSNNNFVMLPLDVDGDASTARSSSADLAIPAGARVLYAGLFWGAARTAGTSGTAASGTPGTIKFRTPGQTGYTSLSADRVDTNTLGTSDYSAYRNVTSLVQGAGAGTYWSADMVAATGADRYAGWSLVVALEDPAAPLRDLSVFSGYATVTGTTETVDTTISGFLTPQSGAVGARFGTVTYEGDAGLTGDYMQVGTTRLADAQSPSANFFGSRVTSGGSNLTNRNPNGVNNLGVDAKVVDAPGVLPNGATSANIRFATAGDFYYPAAITTQVDLFAPTIQGSKSVTNLSGNTPAKVGDVLEYSLTYSNTGDDPAINSVVTDALPPDVTYVPGSIRYTAGGGQGTKTDAPGDDQAEYDAASRSIRARIGRDATATTGGALVVSNTSTVVFRVRVDAAAAGTTVRNTASLAYRAQTIGRDYTYQTAEVATPVADEADVAITKTATPEPVTAGNEVTYTLTVRNNGPSAAAGVQVLDTLPAGVTYVSSNPSTGSCTFASPTLTCDLGAVANGATATVPVVVRVPPGSDATSLTNVARVTSTTSDPDPANNSASATSTVVRQADVALTKSAAPANPIPGTDVTYTLVATNNGASRAADVTVTDTLPTSLTVRSATSDRGTCTITGSQVACAAGGLDPGQSATVTVVATVPSNASTASLTNAARVTSATPDPTPGNNAATATITPAAARADLVVTKEPVTTPVVAGRPVQYLVTVTNNGPSDAADVTLADPVPASLSGITATSGAGSCTVTGQDVSCALGGLASGQSVQVRIGGQLAAGATGTLANTATASSPTADPTPGNNAGASSAPITASADLAITKTAGTVVDGGEAVYTIVVTNNGPSVARDVQVTDPVPAPLTFTTASSSTGTCTTSGSTTVTCAVGDLAVGASATVTVRAQTPGDGSARGASNTATTSSPTPDPVAGNNSATYVLPTVAEADVALSKTVAPRPVVAGQTVTWTLTARNNGPSQATGVTITDTVPADVVGVSAATSTPGATCAAPGGDVSCTVPTLANGATFVVTVSGTVRPDAATGALSNSAQVTATTPVDPSPDNNSASATAEVVTRADVSVVKDGPADAVAGGQAEWTVRVRNDGPSTATGVRLTDALPAGVTFVSATSAPAGVTCTAEDGQVTCPIGALAPGQELLVTVRGTIGSGVTGGTTLTNTVGATSTTPDPTPGNNTDAHSLDVTESSDVRVAKTSDPATLVPGAQSTYVLAVTNDGPSDARDVVVTDTLDADLTVLEATIEGGTCAVSGQTVTCTRPLLPDEATATARIRVLVDAERQTPLANTASVTSASDTTPANNADDLTSDVSPSADVTITKSVSRDRVAAGEGVTYTLTVVNNGPSVADAVTVADSLPADVVPATADASAGTCTIAGQNVSCPLGDVAPGSPVTVTIAAATNPGAAPGPRSNTATVSSPTDTTPGNNSGTASVDVRAEADVQLTKAASSDTFVPGLGVSWSIVVNNVGPSTARDVVVTDTVPDGVTVTDAFHGTGSPCVVLGQQVTCNLGDRAPGQRVVTITGTLASGYAAMTLGNTARVDSTSADPAPGNNDDSAVSGIVRQADLEVVKTIDDPTPVAGQRISYTLSAYNNGPSTAINPQLIDQLPAGLTDVVIRQPTLAGQPAVATCELRQPVDPGTVDNPNAPTTFCTGPQFRAGLPARVIGVIEATVTPGFTGTLTNTGRISSDTIDLVSANNESTISTVVQASADVSITKTVSPATPVPGEPVTWTVTARNDGPSTARDVVVRDDVDDAITGLTAGTGSTPNPCTVAAGNDVTCTLGDLGPNQTVTITLAGGVPSGFTGGLDNTATISSPTDTTPGNNSATVTSTPAGRADVSITKSVSPATPVPGQRVTWTIGVTNAGPSVARDVTMSDDVLDQLTDVAVTSDDPTSQCTVAAGNQIDCDLGDLAPGAEITITVTGAVPGSYTGPVDNTATVSSPTDATPGNNQATTEGDAQPSADVSVTKTLEPARPVPGQSVTWRVEVTNAGPSTARDVVLTDDVPAAVSGVTATSDGCTVAGNEVSCDLGDLASGTTLVVTVRGILDGGFTGDLANTAEVASPTDSSPANNSSTAVGPVAPQADLSITKTMAPAQPVAGGDVTFTMVVRNAGPSTARQVVVSDTLIAALDGATATITPEGSCLVQDQQVTCGLASLPSGQQATVTVRATVDAAYTGEVTNVAAVRAATTDPDEANNTARVSESGTGSCVPADGTRGKVVVCPEIGIDKTASPRAAAPGDTVTYTITVVNKGPSAAKDVEVVDRLDGDLGLVTVDVVSGRADVTISGRTVTAVFGAIRPRAEGMIRIVTRLADDASGSVPNVAVATTSLPEVGDVAVQDDAEVEILADDTEGEGGDGGSTTPGNGGSNGGLPDTGLSASTVPLAVLSVLLVGLGLLLVRRSRVSDR